MAMQRYHWINTRQYAQWKGIAERTARRHILSEAGVQRTGRGYRIPVTNSVYASIVGQSPRTTRRYGVLGSSPTDVRNLVSLPSPMHSTHLVPTRYFPDGILVDSRPFQYQGWALIQFISSGDIIRVYTRRILSSVALTYRQLDKLIRDDIHDRFMRSPIEILATGSVKRNCIRG